MRIEDIESQGRLALLALLAEIDQADDARQIPLLKAAIEMILGRVSAAEQAYYDFLGECVMLAAQNMQDVRLHDLERRLNRLENPEGPSASDVLIETGLILAVELVMAIGAPWLAATVMTFASCRWIARSSRITEKGAGFLRRMRDTTTYKLEAGEREILRARERLRIAETRLRAAAGDPYNPLPTQILVDDVVREAAALRNAESAVLVAGQELAGLDARSSRADAMIAAHQSALSARAAQLKSRKLTAFLNGTAGHTLKGRLGESGGQQVARLFLEASKQSGNGNGPTAHSPFLSSTVVGQMLGHLRRMRMEAARGHDFTRQLLARLEESDFDANALAHDIARGLFDAIGPLEDTLALADAARPAIVRGYEAVLWHEWLSITGALRIDRGRRFNSGIRLESGDIHEGHLVEKRLSEPQIEPGEFGGLGAVAAIGSSMSATAYLNEGDYYHGLSKLTEHQAFYLYDTFASAFFDIPENASLLPFKSEYDPTRYQESLGASPRTSEGLVNNPQRQHRIDEIRIMVVIFFRHFVDARRSNAGYGAITDDTILIDDFMRQFPDPPPPADDPLAADPADVAARLSVLFGQSGVQERYGIGFMLAAFEDRLILLEQKLWIHELVYSQLSFESAEAPDGKTAYEAEREILDLQMTVETDYAQIVDALGTHLPDALSDFKKLYEARKNALAGWQPGTSHDSRSIFDRP